MLHLLRDDILDFTSATEGEEGGSSSAWDLVPQELPKIARKIGTKSDSELDYLMKKVIKEAESSPPDTSKQAHRLLLFLQGGHHLHCRGASKGG